ncbi:hypothetical protein SAMN05421543_11926 [Alicyclobacillus macrosporangiidus]|uniref:Uncharacterized protein n=1 Tax=Alicyclobacillus macrosporangiidus TaxID=392015 RepID=A0A1I7KU19_9BACL|nr:hypothetical protein SAMN05421543_11926 [Alicyclobacillus macrosporangiidus]
MMKVPVTGRPVEDTPPDARRKPDPAWMRGPGFSVFPCRAFLHHRATGPDQPFCLASQSATFWTSASLERVPFLGIPGAGFSMKSYSFLASQYLPIA